MTNFDITKEHKFEVFIPKWCKWQWLIPRKGLSSKICSPRPFFDRRMSPTFSNFFWSLQLFVQFCMLYKKRHENSSEDKMSLTLEITINMKSRTYFYRFIRQEVDVYKIWWRIKRRSASRDFILSLNWRKKWQRFPVLYHWHGDNLTPLNNVVVG